LGVVSKDLHPSEILHFVGMACSLMPSTIGGYYFYLLGASKDAVDYSVVLSYVAGAVWWLWWIHRYSKISRVICARWFCLQEVAIVGYGA